METLTLETGQYEDGGPSARDGLVERILDVLAPCGCLELHGVRARGQALIDLHWTILCAGRLLGRRLQVHRVDEAGADTERALILVVRDADHQECDCCEPRRQISPGR